MRAALILAALTLGQAAPLAAQESATLTLAPATEPPAPGPIMLVSGPDGLLMGNGSGILDPEVKLCLSPNDIALLSSDRVTFQIAGEGCYVPAEAEAEAFANEQRALVFQRFETALAEYDAAIASGDEATKERAYERYAELAQNLPEGEWVDEVAKAREDAIAQRELEQQMRDAPLSAALPGTGSARPPSRRIVPPRPIIFRLASATPAVLQRFPRGTLVEKTTELCLNDGEQATVSGSHGQSVTYTGPGCLRRKAQPTNTNIGGFTFG